MINYLVHKGFRVLNWMLTHQWKIVGGLFLAAFLVGSYGFLDVIPKFPNEPFATGTSILYLDALILGFFNLIVGHTDNLNNALITISQVLAYLALTFAVIITVLKKLVAGLKLKTMNKVPHSLIIGLGENNRNYLLSEEASNNHDNIIIIEPDPNNIHIEQFRDKGFGVFIGTLDEYKVNFPQLKRVVISTGSDRINIEIAGKLISMIPDTMKKEEFGDSTIVHVHLQNQDYKALFQQKILSGREDIPLEFKPYSFNDDAARQLFENHTLLGNYYSLAKTDESYSVVVVGNGDLAERIIYHLCMQTNLPNKNHLTIHCVCEDAPAFLAHIRSSFTGIESISSVSLKGHSLHMDTPEFFSSYVWRGIESISAVRLKNHSLHKKTPEFFSSYVWWQHNLTNVFICHDDENINLECTVNLHDKVFLRQSTKTKVHFAMYHNMELSRSINENREEFKEFYTFGDAKAICDREHFIDEKYESIAKLIHYGYAGEYDKEQLLSVDDVQKKEEINTQWHDSTIFNKRESNRSQALHINTKLMALGLKKVKSEELFASELLEHNHKMMEVELKKFPRTDDEILELSKKLYSDKKVDQDAINAFFDDVMKSDDMYSKLAKAEHERWNAFHYLNGWIYDKNRDDTKKHHNCLVPMEEFSDIDRQQTIIYDLYATLYIPNYLASTGYRIVPIEDASIGVTGHRDINMDDDKLNECLKDELEKVIASYGNIELISPLAEGADRLFVDLAIEVDAQKIKKLTVPMPFEKKNYKQDFKDSKSKKEFESFLSKDGMTIDVYSLSEVKERLQVFIDDFIERAYASKNDLFNAVEKEDYDHVYKVLEWLYKIASNLEGVKKEIPSLPSIKCLKSKEKESVDAFLELFYQSISVLETKDLEKEFYDKQYEKTGKEVVAKSDILFAIWDGEKANGKGGTAKIVDYAISKKKKIVWINPNTYELTIASYPYCCKNADK